MWIDWIELTNMRGFVGPTRVELSKHLNILVGPNNAGKSTIIKAFYLLQDPTSLNLMDQRAESTSGQIKIALRDTREIPLKSEQPSEPHPSSKVYIYEFQDGSITTKFEGTSGSSSSARQQFSPTEPNNLIYPFLSKRKVSALGEQISQSITSSVPNSFQNLNAKIDRLSNPSYPKYQEFQTACQDVLGFSISCSPSPNGKEAGIIVNENRYIPLNAMGEGVVNILGLIVNLCVAEEKIFLIEELENDIHPQALKALLELVSKKAKTNQFLLSTHSNIVTKNLGAHSESKIFYISMEIKKRLPTSHIKLIENTSEARLEILEDLGYELSDFEFAKAWLFFEESTAERIVRDFLVPWFTPSLRGNLKTFSARSISEVRPKFNDFDRLYVYAHLEPVYKNRAWVIVDGCAAGKEVIEKLRTKYSGNGWNDNRFRHLSVTDFELLYPKQFQKAAKQALDSNDTNKKRKAKKKLFDDVLAWIKEDEEKAKNQFLTSAAEVIKILKEIEEEISV